MNKWYLLLLSTIIFLGCESDTRITYKLTVNNKSLSVELADNEQTRAQGLKYRDSLASDRGMLFAYPDERVLHFWMKDTAIPLSIAFIKADGSIMEIKDMQPFSLESVTSSGPVQYALETNRGWFAGNQIKPGDKVTFPAPLTDRLQKQ